MQCLYTIQFKNLDSQSVLGYGFSGAGSITTSATNGTLNNYGLNYGKASHYSMKFLGLENLYGSKAITIDGVLLTSDSNILVIDSTMSNSYYNDTGSGYVNRGGTSGVTPIAYTTQIIGTNEGGFMPTISNGSSSTYYCDVCLIGTTSGNIPNFGGFSNSGSDTGMFSMRFNTHPNGNFLYTATHTTRLVYFG